MKQIYDKNIKTKTQNEIDFDLQILNLIREIHASQEKNFIVDLHTHTIFSDGFLTPKELIHRAVKNNINIIAITDHNSVEGIIEALEATEEIKERSHEKIYVIPGIEISTAINDKKIHIVGLFINIYNPYLLDCVEKVKSGHFERAKIQLERLDEIGIHIEFDKYKQIVGTRCPNWKTMAEAIVRYGYANDIDEARRLYTKKGRPAHVPYTEKWSKITPVSAITAIKKAGGLTFIAHLGDLVKEFGTEETQKLIYSLIKTGLDGVDLSLRNNLHSSISDKLMKFVRNKKLFMIRGSDFHRDENLLRTSLTKNEIYYMLYKRIKCLIEEQHYKNILQKISFSNLTFFPSQIIPNDFINYDIGVRDKLLKRGLNSPYLLIDVLINDKADNCLLWNIGLEALHFAISAIKAEHFLTMIVCKETNVIRKIIEDRIQKTAEITQVEKLDFLTKKFLEDNLLIYSPIAYRLSYYDMGYKLRAESKKKLHPNLWGRIESLYDNLLSKTFKLTREDIDRYIENKKNDFYSIFKEIGFQDIEIHSRIKQPVSLWDKLKISWFVGYDWKNPEAKKDAEVFLEKVSDLWIRASDVDLNWKEFSSIFEDFIGFRIIIKDYDKEVYKVINNVVNELLYRIYKVEIKPRRWHHKRLLIWGWDKYSQAELPIEIQCMNWPDYLLSRAYYWHSKGIYIFYDVYPHSKSNNYDMLIEELKNSESDDLHNMMLKEIKNRMEGKA